MRPILFLHIFRQNYLKASIYYIIVYIMNNKEAILKENTALKQKNIELEEKLQKYTNSEGHKRYYEKNKQTVKDKGKTYLQKLKEENQDKLKEYRKTAYLNRKEKLKKENEEVI